MRKVPSLCPMSGEYSEILPLQKYVINYNWSWMFSSSPKLSRLLSGLVGLVIIIFPQSALELFLPSLDRRREFFLRNCISTDQPNMSYTFGTLRETNLIGPVKNSDIRAEVHFSRQMFEREGIIIYVHATVAPGNFGFWTTNYNCTNVLWKSTS